MSGDTKQKAIDTLVEILAPVLTHGQGMRAREREEAFRKALADLVAPSND